MDVNSEAAESAAYTVRWQAETLARKHHVLKGNDGLVPAQWTAWLLMEKAGMPLRVIVWGGRDPESHIARRLMLAKMLMMWPPYAASVERLAAQMPRFQKVRGKLLGARSAFERA